jgi:hypothetical protein
MNVVRHDNKGVEAYPLAYSHVIQTVGDDSFDDISPKQVHLLYSGAGDEIVIRWIKHGTYWHIWPLSCEGGGSATAIKSLSSFGLKR